MRSFIALLTLFASLVAPLAAPAAAMTVAPVAVECDDGAMADHEMPASDHEQGAPCCIAVPPAIDPPSGAATLSIATERPSFLALTESFRLGAGLHTEDPPPRTA